MAPEQELVICQKYESKQQTKRESKRSASISVDDLYISDLRLGDFGGYVLYFALTPLSLFPECDSPEGT